MKGIIRRELRAFDPLGIGAWAPLSEFESMLPTICELSALPEDVFVEKAAEYFLACFAEGELGTADWEVRIFFRGLYRLLADGAQLV